MGQSAGLLRCHDPSASVCEKYLGEVEATGEENTLQLLTEATVAVHVSGLFSHEEACALAKPKAKAETSSAVVEGSSVTPHAAPIPVTTMEAAEQVVASQGPTVSSSDMCQKESSVTVQPNAAAEVRPPGRRADEDGGRPGDGEGPQSLSEVKGLHSPAEAGSSALQKAPENRASVNEELGKEESTKPKSKPLADQQVLARKTARKPQKKDEIVAQGKTSERSRRKLARKEESSDDSDTDLAGCPSSKQGKDFERELKKVKKQMRSGSTSQPVEVPNHLLYTEAGVAERQLKKDMFISFYREQYARLKQEEKPAQPDVGQYSPAAANGLAITEGHRYMPRPEHVDLPNDFRKPVGTLTPKQLAAKGCKSKRLLVCIHGDLFDVSDRPDKYGSNGPYWYMTGHDITWGLISGDDAEEFMDFYYDIFKVSPMETADRKLQGLMSWWAFFEKEYGSPVGRLDVYETEWALPPPPDGSLDTECCVM